MSKEVMKSKSGIKHNRHMRYGNRILKVNSKNYLGKGFRIL